MTIRSSRLSRDQGAHDPERAQRLRRGLLDWYKREHRELPWRGTNDAYVIWLSEIMLQQTRVETVVPYFVRFLAHYPTVHALAEAPLDDVLARWSGLGYYRRARMLHAAARAVSEQGGAFPDSVDGLRAIPGVGAYTAGAIASIAFGRRAATVDGNVVRVLSRLFAVEEDVRGGAGLARIWAIAAALVPEHDAGAWNQALMELGATVCAPKKPSCAMCPVRAECTARKLGIEGELPRLAPKKKPVTVKRAAIVATRGGNVLLARRRREGTFGGMWEPPSLDAQGGEDLRAAFEPLVGARVVSLEQAGEVVHVLSHRRLEVLVHRARLGAKRARSGGKDYDAVAWMDLNRTNELGISTFARKILAAAARPRVRSRST